ncbi:MAG: gamma carbonic anhydrase family protein [Alphaproteobacteria bacterium]
MSLFELDGVKPDLHTLSWVASTAVCIGKVCLKQDASVWWNAVLRGDNEWITLGQGSNVQDGCVLHTDPGFPLTIGANVTVGHKAILHGCTIGDGALIGMGATVLNGAVIGEGALVGAGAFVGEGKHIPAGALVMGVPGKVVRTLTPEQISKMQEGALRYQENWKRYSETCKILTTDT